MNVMVWNYCGIDNEVIIRAINNFVRIYDPVILVLVETIISRKQALDQSSKLGFLNYHIIYVNGLRGRI